MPPHPVVEIGTVQLARGYGWLVTWADGNTAKSEKPFKTLEHAERDLMKVIKDRRSELLYSISTPAKVSMAMD